WRWPRRAPAARRPPGGASARPPPTTGRRARPAAGSSGGQIAGQLAELAPPAVRVVVDDRLSLVLRAPEVAEARLHDGQPGPVAVRREAELHQGRVALGEGAAGP